MRDFVLGGHKEEMCVDRGKAKGERGMNIW